MPSRRGLSSFEGKHVVVMNWRDIDHPQAGGAEQYMHEIARRWVLSGISVTWITGRSKTQESRTCIDGLTVIRRGGPFSMYLWAPLQVLAMRGKFDAIVDCQNGIPFFSPLFVRKRLPIVQVVHHVHQEQFSRRFARPVAALGRFMEAFLARWVYGTRPVAAVSPSTRTELRALDYAGPITVVPNGTIQLPEKIGPRHPAPRITVVSRLVAHKRLDLLLAHISTTARKHPGLRVDIVGDGPERRRLQYLAEDLGIQSTVKFHGYQRDSERDRLLRSAWFTVSTSAAEGWGCSVIEAAAWGVPCLALRVPGIRDSVIDQRTGWLVDSVRDFDGALDAAIKKLSDKEFAAAMASSCREWARSFDWDRSTNLMAGLLAEEVESLTRRGGRRRPDKVRSDGAILAIFKVSEKVDLDSVLRPTDEFVSYGNDVWAILKGYDRPEALKLMDGIGASCASLQLASNRDLLAGPAGALRLSRLIEAIQQ